MASNQKRYEAQKLLYVWLSKLGRKSLDSIKANCDYLAENQETKSHDPIWEIFWPLVFSGVADHAGKGYYALTEPLILNYKTHFYYINILPKECKSKEIAVGIYVSDTLVNEHNVKMIEVEPKAILKKFPPIDNVVDSFDKSIQDENELKYYNSKTRKGVAKLEKEGLKKFFSIPDKGYMRELPSKTNNPEAFAIAYCYGRIINGETNGTYNRNLRRLVMPKFAMPFTLYRVLQLETMKTQHLPQKSKDSYIFNDVSVSVVKELNRIFCNSIKYE